MEEEQATAVEEEPVAKPAKVFLSACVSDPLLAELNLCNRLAATLEQHNIIVLRSEQAGQQGAAVEESQQDREGRLLTILYTSIIRRTSSSSSRRSASMHPISVS